MLLLAVLSHLDMNTAITPSFYVYSLIFSRHTKIHFLNEVTIPHDSNSWTKSYKCTFTPITNQHGLMQIRGQLTKVKCLYYVHAYCRLWLSEGLTYYNATKLCLRTYPLTDYCIVSC